MKTSFPENFLWGAATASYQVEGAAFEDGRGESIWDRFSHTPGNVLDGDTGDVACDHYHLWQDDIELMKQLGINAYRFSIAWPRIFPRGDEQFNQAGVDFYSRLVDGLLQAGITPMATLYHWDLPQPLQDAGGWPARSIVPAFVNYVNRVTRSLGDRVKMWATLNEPSVSAFMGYEYGRHAPGIKDKRQAILAAHHLLLSHGQAVPVIKANVPDAKVGIVINLSDTMPASDAPGDIAGYHIFDGVLNRWMLDPLFGRHYPADVVSYYAEKGFLLAKELDFVQEGDMKTIAAPMDYLGINYYSRAVVTGKLDEKGNLESFGFDKPTQSEYTDYNWEVYPHGLQEILTRVYSTYRPKEIYVTENGAAYNETPDAEGKVHDQRRVAFIEKHLESARQAISNGVPLCGYFAWSLMDNFEWGVGYSQRFGMIFVDYATRRRYPKDSYWAYRELIKKFKEE